MPNPTSHLLYLFKSTNTKTSCVYQIPDRRSSSSSQPPFRRVITVFCSSSSLRWFSEIALSRSFNWSSVTFCRSWPDCASIIRRFSMSIARDSLTRRMRFSRSTASGSRIWFTIAARRSAVGFLCGQLSCPIWLPVPSTCARTYPPFVYRNTPLAPHTHHTLSGTCPSLTHFLSSWPSPPGPPRGPPPPPPPCCCSCARRARLIYSPCQQHTLITVHPRPLTSSNSASAMVSLCSRTLFLRDIRVDVRIDNLSTPLPLLRLSASGTHIRGAPHALT